MSPDTGQVERKEDTLEVNVDGTVTVTTEIDPSADREEIQQQALDALSEEYPEIEHVDFVWTPTEVYYER